MFLPFYIAKRYLVSKKSHNIINIISIISVVGVAIGTMALVVILSVFNGFEDLVKSLYNTFDPDVKISIKEGKTFDPGMINRENIKNIPGIVSYTEVLEENVLLKNKSEQVIVTMKGVSDAYLADNPLDSMLFDGDFVLERDGYQFSIMGYLVAYNLGIKLFDFNNPVQVYVPRRTKKALTSFEGSFNSDRIFASAVFAVQQDIDSKYVIVPIDFARSLLEFDREVSSIEIRFDNKSDQKEIIDKIKVQVGPEFVVKDRYQQQELLYKIMKTEKWAIFFILTFILIIAAFNVIGSISMLILDKRKDISVLYSMGASKSLIKRIFYAEGVFVSLTGAFSGLILGFLLCILQIEFGLIRLGDANSFIIPYYPVKVELMDFIAVFFTVLLIGVLSAWFPVNQISSRYLEQRIGDFAKTV